jgi:hypothetical protein
MPVLCSVAQFVGVLRSVWTVVALFFIGCSGFGLRVCVLWAAYAVLCVVAVCTEQPSE